MFKLIRKIDVEIFIWSAALLYLALIDPYADNHVNLCLLNAAGFEYCPGCGLGLSASFVFHGDITASLNAHPLGIAAIPILLYRIFILLKRHFEKTDVSQAADPPKTHL